MTVHRTIWPSVRTELRIITNPADSIAASRITLYVAEGVFSFCFPLSPEAARALAADLVAGAEGRDQKPEGRDDGHRGW